MKLLNLIFSYLKNNTKNISTANIAKERLKIIFSHEKSKKNNSDFLIKMQKEIMQVIFKYTKVQSDQIKIDFGKKGDCSILELNIIVPENIENSFKETKKLI